MAKKNLDGRYDLRAISILEIDTKYALIQCIDSKKEIEFAISLIGVAASNYYHFTVELLSRIQYIDNFEEYRSVPILVDKAVKNIPQYYDLLNTINKYNHPVIFIDKNMNYKVKKLIYVSYNTWMPINIKEGLELCSRDWLISESAVKYIRNSIIEDNTKNGFRKIFISRKNTVNSRLINEKDVVGLFKIYGFEIIYPEKMTFKQQVKIFSEAEYVAGATGAAFTNIIYCPQNAKILCIIPRKYNGLLYSSIANIVKLKNIFIDAEEIITQKQNSSSKFILDLNYCNSLLKSILNDKDNIYEITEALVEMKQYMHKNCNICNEEIINKIVSCFEKLRNVDFYKDVNKYFHTLNFIKNIKEIFYEILLIKNNTEQFMLIEFLYKYIKMHIEMNELKE
nr:glycosyltransferase family 61 protein [Clostridium beijerinckii]